MSRSSTYSIKSSDSTDDYIFADNRSEMLTWLSPLEPRIRHRDVRTRRTDNVKELLLQTGEFRRWCDGAQHGGSDYAILFCCGDPGVGKTYFSSLVVDKLCDNAKEKDIAVAHFYIDFAAREEQSPKSILGSLLKQIVGGLEKAPDEVKKMFEDHNKEMGETRLRVVEIVKMLQAVTSLQPTFICVDALDECVEGHRPEILGSLRQILEKSPNTRIFLTGRPHVRSEINKHLGQSATVLSIKPNRDDIVGYVRMRLREDTYLDRMDSGLGDEILKCIPWNTPQTFLQISLTMDAILGETTAYGRRQKLRVITEGLDLKGVYDVTLARINEQDGEKAKLGMAALMWISYSERPLKLDELLHALAVDIGSTDLDLTRIPCVETLLNCCLGLVLVDRKASTVRLIHSTLREYLYTFSEIFGPTHSSMAETCLTYLNFQTIKKISSTQCILPQLTPFLKYCSLYWGAHARREATRVVVSLALKLFDQIESHISTKLLLMDLISKNSRYNWYIPTNGPLIGFTGLHCVSVFGIIEIATTLLRQPNPRDNKRDFLGITPLIWTAICGQAEVTKLLLERQTVNPDKQDGYFGRTALSWAAVEGHQRIVRLLLEWASPKPDGTDGWWGKTPHMMNMVRGRRYVDPKRPDTYGQTAILLAAEEGHEGVVKLLLGREDINPNMSGKAGMTPLLLASCNGHEGVVMRLLERKCINPNIQDDNGKTPLWWAAENKHEGVVNLLLRSEDVNPNVRDRGGLTPLWSATERGDGRIVKLLLGREDVNPDIPDRDGRTPLLMASKNRDERMLKLLSREDDIDLDTPSPESLTPPSLPLQMCSEVTAGLLHLARRAVGLDTP